MLRIEVSRAAQWRRPMAAALLLVVTALTVLLLVAPGAGAAPTDPKPDPSPSSSFPQYEPGRLDPKPGLYPSAPGILPPESRKPLDPGQDTDKTKDKGKGTGAKGEKKPPAKKLTEKEKKEAKQAKMRKEMAAKVKEYKAKHGDGGVLNSFDVTDSNNLPVSAYRIESDAGGVTNPIGQLQSAITQGLFEATKWAIAFGCWLITWALQWSLARIFLKPALAISDSLYSQTIVQLGLPGLLMAFSGAVAFWNITFGRTSRGWGELFASTMISALAVSTLAAPPQLLLGEQDGAVGQARALGISVYAITTGNEKALSGTATLTEAKTKELTRAVTDGIVDAFVVKPAFLLSYNQQLSKKCAALYGDSRVEQAFFNDQVDSVKNKKGSKWNFLLNPPGIVGDINKAIQDKVVDYVVNDVLGLNPGEDFEDACVKDAGNAKKAGWDKVGGACFIFIAALLMTLLLTVTACAYLSTEVRLGLEAILAKVALTAGIMPGAGRAWMWERATTILRLLGMLITLVVALAIVVQTVTAVLGTDFSDEGGLPAQFVVVDITVIAAFFLRKRIKKRSVAWASSVRSRLGNSPLGGRAPATMDQASGRKRSVASTMATTALMIAGTAATGGTGAAAGGARMLALSGRGSAALGARLGTRMAVRGTIAAGRGAEKAVVGTAKAAYGAGKFGLKYTVGAPVYGPQAARTVSAGLKAAPGSLARSASQLRSRISEPVAQRMPAARAFGRTWIDNTGGGWVWDRVRMHRGLPPRPRPSSPPRPAGTARTAPARPLPSARPASAASSPARRRAPRPAAPRPAASSQQQALRQRLYRMSTDATRMHRAPNPRPVPEPAAPRPRPARATRRRTP
ncbi:hypothetical protein K388_06959 [Streptomyces sp. KhCrAH-43]|uniref:hypothetical protein n=1 Tax=unclassified Streptomyces TaxID=2593676 RepID=UPI00056917F3|nr:MULTISPECIES: hypothetical protein [unclassified Streptomyces]MYS39640.1 hypothetical protein [Streptomyces sp. SID4920]MYX64320.1 hypothetical protein [Streptomyces sp. SID8373]RAJ48611.1 hypothetical protein K388_06959 [Streptomyces sp. KhCrAH-43]